MIKKIFKKIDNWLDEFFKDVTAEDVQRFLEENNRNI